jgi:hypothetical protein
LCLGTTILGAFETTVLRNWKAWKSRKFTIHLYTDGLTEAMNKREEFGRRFGICRFKLCVDPMLVSSWFSQINLFCKAYHLKDDLTLLSLIQLVWFFFHSVPTLINPFPKRTWNKPDGGQNLADFFWWWPVPGVTNYVLNELSGRGNESHFFHGCRGKYWKSPLLTRKSFEGNG